MKNKTKSKIKFNTIFKKFFKLINFIEKPIEENNTLVHSFLKKDFNEKFSLEITRNFTNLQKIHKFMTNIMKDRGNFLFILPDEKEFWDLNKNFIEFLNKSEISYIHNKSSKRKLGVLTNRCTLNELKEVKSRIKEADLIFMLSPDTYYKKIIIKEAFLLNTPIISFLDYETDSANIIYPLIGDLNKTTLAIYYMLLSRILSQKVKYWDHDIVYNAKGKILVMPDFLKIPKKKKKKKKKQI